jgi:hypothetical protein
LGFVWYGMVWCDSELKCVVTKRETFPPNFLVWVIATQRIIQDKDIFFIIFLNVMENGKDIFA